MTGLPLLFIILISTVSFGQNPSDIETRVKKFQDSLKQNSIDTFFKYSLVCLGSMYPADTCDFFDNSYLLWKQNGVTFLKKFDGCKIYKTVMLDPINPLTFYISRHKKIESEIIYRPTYIQSKHGNTVTTIEQTIDHTCFYEMAFLIKKKQVFKNISDYDLTFKEFDNGRKNMYYNYNQHTELKKLIEQITRLLKRLNIEEKFEIQ